jgi:hypothetical protein
LLDLGELQRFRVFSDLVAFDLVGDPHHVVVRANRGECQAPLGVESVHDQIAIRHHQVFLTAARARDWEINGRFVHRDREIESRLRSEVGVVSRKLESNQTDHNRRHVEKIALREASMHAITACAGLS